MAMVRPLSEHARLILELIKAHPGVQAKYITAELAIKEKDLMIALTILQGRGLIEGKLNVKFNKRKHTAESAIRFYPKI